MKRDQSKHDKPATAKSASHHNYSPEAVTSPERAMTHQPQQSYASSLFQKPDTIVRLQSTIGNRAVQRMIQNSQTIQRALNVTTESLATPAGQVRSVTGASNMKKDLSLPGGRVEDTDRPLEAKTIVDKTTLRPEERATASILGTVTGMARDEQKILKGVATNKYFDAGHLIADELVAGDPTVGTKGSFTYGNLAPQQSTFNQVSYRVFEGKIRRWAEWGNKVEVTTTLTYDGNYDISNQELIDNGVVKKTIKQTDLGKTTNIARRVPKTWKIHAKILGYKRGPKKEITEGQKRSKFQQSLNHTNALPNSEIPAGTGHKFTLAKETLSNGKGKTYTKPTDNTIINQGKNPKKSDSIVKEKEMSGKQWTPTNAPSLEEIVSLIQASYPKLGIELIRHLVNEGKFMIDISQVDNLLDVKSPLLEQLLLQYKTEIDPNFKEPTTYKEAIECCEAVQKWLKEVKVDLEDDRKVQQDLLIKAQDPVKLASIGSAYLETLEAISINEKSLTVVLQAINYFQSLFIQELIASSSKNPTPFDPNNDNSGEKPLKKYRKDNV